MTDDKQNWEATGRRKESAARVRLTPGTGIFTINGRDDAEYFRRPSLLTIVRKPLACAELDGRFDVDARVNGGGTTGGAGAISHALSRALLEYDPELRAVLKKGGYLTRDSRTKERKKPGLKGARARFQFSKR
ncbi:MAG: small subunit ribosomal protein S9 [Myxococcota bacterium]|jgi:small subunit ribosomal protein S9